MSKEREQDQVLPERWSAKAKSDVVLRLFRGESVDAVSREIQVPVHEIETWRKDFLAAGMARLKKRGGDLEERALKQTQAKVGELAMKLELAELLLEKRPSMSRVPPNSDFGIGSRAVAGQGETAARRTPRGAATWQR